MCGMEVAIACGGTGGHVFPGLAVAEALRDRGHGVTLWLSGRGVEPLSAAAWNGPIETVRAAGFPSGFSLRSLGVIARLVAAVRHCKRRMTARRPDIVLAMGSYASIGPGFAAKALGIPLVLHEANAIPGRAISLLSRSAAVTALTFEQAAAYLPGRRTVVTGFPLRRKLDGAFGPGVLDPERFTVLIMGGSQGAHALNVAGAAAVCRLHARKVPIQAVHLAGTDNEASVRERYRATGAPALVFGFLDDMGAAYSAADLAIARAGAATCAELAATGTPALLVPLPTAARDHQSANAEAMAGGGGADRLDQECLTAARLADYIDGCRTDRGKLDCMRQALLGTARKDAVEELVGLLEQEAGI